ncbi:MAG TPA: PD-(D/E)XK nuclease family protein, partial [Gammaproteobacteria bacterium]
WQAWQQQLNALQYMDAIHAYHLRLANSQQVLSGHWHFYIVNAEQLDTAEKDWCTSIETQHSIKYIEQLAEKNNNAALSVFIHQAYDTQQTLIARSQQLPGNIQHQHITQHLSLFAASSAEQEAMAVELQVRIWLLQGKTNIAVITEDRKLARRIRALLERANVIIQDTAGWSLSTTSAASSIERWLECIEEDFAHQPLVDLLKSPFFMSAENRDQHLAQVYRFEQDIIRHEKITRDINRYRKALKSRQGRLQWPAESYDKVNQLLSVLETSAESLRQLYSSASNCHPKHYLDAFIESLNTLSIHELLDDDIAGKRILQEINKMQAGLNHAAPDMRWQDFRTWLGSILETSQFTPQDLPSVVQLMNMKQAQYCHFDALVIAGTNRSHFPGYAAQIPFFNHNVRQSLGLKSWPENKQDIFHRFRCLLEAADTLLISYKCEQDGEWLQASPWVSSLDDFSRLCWDTDLHNDALPGLLKQKIALQNDDHAELPVLQLTPKTSVSPELIPASYSATSYQRLVNCPYQFFAADALKLRAEEHIIEGLQKSDYGQKIHQILCAFHQQTDHMPEPFTAKVTLQNRQQALDHLIRLSTLVFEKDIEDNVQHRGWLQRWLMTAPAYIDWLIEHQRQWTIDQLEQEFVVDIDERIKLKGRLDRIDKQQNNLSIIDYKTGAVASKAKVHSGEDVQLISYAALKPDVSEVSYLKLDKGEVKAGPVLQDDQLQDLKQQNMHRLQTVIEQLHQQHPLPAWGDTQTCNQCDMQGLCRKQFWENL